MGEGEEVGEDMWIGCCEGGDVGVKGYQKAPWGMAGGGVGAVDCGYGQQGREWRDSGGGVFHIHLYV